MSGHAARPVTLPVLLQTECQQPCQHQHVGVMPAQAAVHISMHGGMRPWKSQQHPTWSPSRKASGGFGCTALNLQFLS